MELNSNLQIYFNLISFFIAEKLFADATVLCILTNISAAPPWIGFEFNLLTRVIIFLKIIAALTLARVKRKNPPISRWAFLIFAFWAGYAACLISEAYLNSA